MGLNLKGLGRGLAAGMQIFGQALSDKEAAAEKERIRLEQQKREDERYLAQRKDAEIRNEQLRIQNKMNMTKLNAEGLAQAAAMRNYHPGDMAPALTQYSPDGRVYQFNEGDSSWNTTNPEGNIVMNVGTYQQNPDGTLKKGPDGKPIFESLPGDMAKAEWSNQADFTEAMTKRSNPAVLFGMQLLDLDGKKARQRAQITADEKAKLEAKTGVKSKRAAEEEKLIAETELLREKKAHPEKFRTPSAAGDKVARVIGLDGKPVELTSQGVNLLRSSMDELGKRYEGVDEGVTYRLSQLRSSTKDKTKIRQVAKLVANDKVNRSKAVTGIMDDYGLTRDIAEDLLDSEIEGSGMDKKGGFFSFLPFIE
jgi:hypothetical protein